VSKCGYGDPDIVPSWTYLSLSLFTENGRNLRIIQLYSPEKFSWTVSPPSLHDVGGHFPISPPPTADLQYKAIYPEQVKD